MEYRLVLRDEINQRMSQLDHRIQKLQARKSSVSTREMITTPLSFHQKKNDALTEEVKRLRDAPPTPSPPEDHPAIEYWRTRYLALANAVRLGAVQPKDASTHTQMVSWGGRQGKRIALTCVVVLWCGSASCCPPSPGASTVDASPRH